MAEEKKSKGKITKEMKIADVLRVKPQAAGIFFAYGMHCLGCSIAVNESIEDASMVHGIDVDELLKRLNEA